MQIIRCFNKWHTFLNTEIRQKRINARVFTANNHYLMHLPFLVEKMGPLKCYSCRPMERTIKKFTNLIKSTHQIGANASNVLRHQANYSKMAVRRLEATQFPESMDRPDTYRSHSSGVQIWSPFVAQSLFGPDEEEICFGVQRSKVIDALISYYDRKDGHAVEALTSSRIEIAGRAWKDDLVFSSIMDITLKRLKTRANSHVLFQAPKSTGHR